MKKNLFDEFYYNSSLSLTDIRRDDFFAEATIRKVKDYLEKDDHKYNRLMSSEEKDVITQDAFELLLFWVECGELKKANFEKFMSLLLTFTHRIETPINKSLTVGMIEIIKALNFEESYVYTTLEWYLDDPHFLRTSYESVH